MATGAIAREVRMQKRVKIAQFGLGPIGLECLKLASTKSWAEVIGAVDIAPGKLGADLGRLTGRKSLRGMGVVGSLDDLPQKPELVLHTAVSRFKTAYTQLEPIAARGIDVVSSCEELLFPFLANSTLAARLDRVCRKSGARIVGTGVNPGFVMDWLPLCFCTVCREVRAIHVQRVVNASTRREPLQRKIGSGQRPRDFKRLLQSGQAGHAGLRESAALVAHALGWRTEKIVETGEAIVAARDIRTAYLLVHKGQVCGLHQRVEAKVGGRVRLTLDLKMALDAANEHDAIQIEGEPPLEMTISRGVPGDSATVAALVNTVPRLLRAAPGFRLVTDLAITPGL